MHVCLKEVGVGGGWEVEWGRFKPVPVPCTGFCLVENAAIDAGLIKHRSGSQGMQR